MTEATTNQYQVNEDGTYAGPNNAVQALSMHLVAIQNEFVSLNTTLQAAEGGRDAAIKSYVETSNDPDALKIREAIAKLQDKLISLAEKSVVSDTMSDEEKEAARTELAAKRDAISNLRKAIVETSSALQTDREGVVAWLSDLKDPSAKRRGAKPGSTREGGPRYSASFKVTGGNYTDESFDTFTALAKGLGKDVNADDLRKALANHAGVDVNELTQKVTGEQTWTFKPHENGSTYTITSTPKARKSGGGRKKKDADAPVETTEAA